MASDHEDERKRQLIAATVRSQADAESEGLLALQALSDRTVVVSIEVFEDELSISGDEFQGPIVWHVDLAYDGAAADEPLQQSDSFPGTVRGHLRGDEVIVNQMIADTRSYN